MTLSPLSDHVIVKPNRESTTPSGLVIPDTVKDAKTDRGEVIAVGPGRVLEDGSRAPMSVAVNDQVLFSKYAADEVEVDGEEFVVISESDVKAIIQN
jgi:chaperonin GroES